MFGRGVNTLQISNQLYAENRTRLVADLRAKVAPGSVVLLEGGIEKNRYNTDAEDLPFRQVSRGCSTLLFQNDTDATLALYIS